MLRGTKKPLPGLASSRHQPRGSTICFERASHMKLPQSLKLDLATQWVLNETMPDGEALPPSVVARWSYFTRQARRSRNGHYLGEVFSLLLAGAVPVGLDLPSRYATSLPPLVPVSNCSCRLRKRIPRSCSCDTVWMRCASERPSRSSRQTTRVSPERT
jgi:hypothetical protein